MIDLEQLSHLQYLDDPEASKTKIKIAMHELQALGEYLLTLNKKKLKTLPMSESLVDAIDDYHNMPSHGAKLRQRQYIGKVMKHEDYLAIAQTLSQETLKDQLKPKPAQLWLVKLLDDADNITTFTQEYTIEDFQQFRQTLRNAQKEWKKDSVTTGKQCQKLKVLINTIVNR